MKLRLEDPKMLEKTEQLVTMRETRAELKKRREAMTTGMKELRLPKEARK